MGDFDRDFILDGVRNGFRIIDVDAAPVPASMENYKSATDRLIAPIVEKQIRTEIEEGRYLVSESKPVIVSALGAIPKQDSNDIRLIHDCSQPSGLAVNDYASLDSKTKYQSIQDAVSILTPKAFMAKVDLKSAYRSVPVHRSNWQALGLQWCFQGYSEPTFMVDTRLPFGSRLAPGIFHRITQSVRRMLLRRGIDGVVVYLDDFLIISNSYQECKYALNTLLGLLRCLGFAISWSKVEGPTQGITFLGIHIDSVNFTLELPPKKLGELRDCVRSFRGRKRASCKALQQLAGKLNWACQVVRGGRTYLRRILDTLRPLRKSHHKAKLSSDFQADITWWSKFLSVFNGRYLALTYAPTHEIYMDACNSGSGFANDWDWAYVNFEADMPEVTHWHINCKEALSAVLAARRWGYLWANSKVKFFTDNTSTKAFLNKGTAKSKAIMPYLRELFWHSAIHNFQISAEYVPGKDNDIPDAISRLPEAGQLMRLGSLLGIPGHMSSIWASHCLSPHMSFDAFNFVFPQIQKLLRLGNNWIGK